MFHTLLGCRCTWAQSCLTLYDTRNPPGSSVHGILQARRHEWAAFPTPGDLPDPGVDWQVDSLPLHHLGSSCYLVKTLIKGYVFYTRRAF